MLTTRYKILRYSAMISHKLLHIRMYTLESACMSLYLAACDTDFCILTEKNDLAFFLQIQEEQKERWLFSIPQEMARKMLFFLVKIHVELHAQTDQVYVSSLNNMKLHLHNFIAFSGYFPNVLCVYKE